MLPLHLVLKTLNIMRKLFLALTIVLGISFAANAQTATPAKAAAQPAKKATTTAAAKPSFSTAAAKTKADGTPDMRYKENKEAKTVPAGPKKADGTPDMRYKKNKAATAPVKKITAPVKKAA